MDIFTECFTIEDAGKKATYCPDQYFFYPCWDKMRYSSRNSRVPESGSPEIYRRICRNVSERWFLTVLLESCITWDISSWFNPSSLLRRNIFSFWGDRPASAPAIRA